MEIGSNKATAELLPFQAKHSNVLLLNESMLWTIRVIQWPIHKDSHLLCFVSEWISRLNDWMTLSLRPCLHLVIRWVWSIRSQVDEGVTFTPGVLIHLLGPLPTTSVLISFEGRVYGPVYVGFFSDLSIQVCEIIYMSNLHMSWTHFVCLSVFFFSKPIFKTFTSLVSRFG